MAVRGNAVHKNHNPTLYIYVLSPHNNLFFHNGCVSGHILESTKGIEIEFGL